MSDWNGMIPEDPRSKEEIEQDRKMWKSKELMQEKIEEYKQRIRSGNTCGWVGLEQDYIDRLEEAIAEIVKEEERELAFYTMKGKKPNGEKKNRI